ncbi:MAG: leucine-rich repeat protein [Lachnospiraceae bacterium]|nr:leucine-rich repeat protein [Lachnospiraceae bacterium]
MKKKIVTRLLSAVLSAALAATSIQIPVLAADGELDVAAVGASVSENGVEGSEEEETEEDPDLSVVETDIENLEGDDEGFIYKGSDIDIFSIDPEALSDQEISDIILSVNDGDVASWISTLSDSQLQSLLERDTILTKPVDVYNDAEDGEDLTVERYETYYEYFLEIPQNVGWTYGAASGRMTMSFVKDGVTYNSTLKISGLPKGESTINNQAKNLTLTVADPRYGLSLIRGGTQTWADKADSTKNYEKIWYHLSFNPPAGYIVTNNKEAVGSMGQYGIKVYESPTGSNGMITSSGTGWKRTQSGGGTEKMTILCNLRNYGVASGVSTQNITHQIVFSPITYTINYNGNGATSIAYTSKGYTYPTNGTDPVVSRTGYRLSSWSGSNVANTQGAVITRTANWTANTYTVTYNGNGGSTPGNTAATYNVAFTLPASTRAGYTFNGWSGAGLSNKTGSVSNLTTVHGATVSLAAQWIANKYTITYNANGGSVTPGSNGVTYGQPCPTAPTPIRKGYTFTGWSGGTSSGTYLTAGNTTVTAGWKANEYTLSFNTDGGSAVADIKATYDKDVILPEGPSKKDYVFAGWSDGVNTYKAGDTVKNLTAEASGKVTFKALWVASTFTVHFDSNGGAQVKDIKYHFGDNTTLPTPSRADAQDGDSIIKYTFAGWQDDKGKVYTTAQDVKADSPLVNGVLNLKATWDESVSKVSEGGGTIIEQPKYETNNYTNNYNMTDEQAKLFLEKLRKGIATEITIKGIRFVTIKNADGSITIRLEDLGGFKDITIPDAIRIGDAVIPVTIIDRRAFMGNTTLERVILGKNVTTIKESAFEGCTNLKQIQFNDGLVTIEKRAFYGCTSLKEIKTSKDLKSIGESAFENCTSLSKVTLNNGLLEIGKKAFRGCKSLTTITIPKSVLKIGNQAFENCTKLTSIKFASGSDLQLIGKSAFAGCKALKSVKLPDKLTVLSDKAFYNCVKLKKVTGGKGLVSIGNKAFMNCKSLTKITLYTNVSKVGKQAFYGCKKLKKVTIKSKVLTKVGSKAFKKCHKKIVFYVPDKAKKAAYKKLLKGKF